MATVTPSTGFNAETDARALRTAMRGIGTDEKAIIEIVAMRSNMQRQHIKKHYKTLYGRDLNEDFKSELTGKLEKCVLALMREPAEYDAWTLHNAFNGLKSNESVVIDVVCTRNRAQMIALFKKYKQMYGKELPDTIFRNSSSPLSALLVPLVEGFAGPSWEWEMYEEELAKKRECDEDGENSCGTDEDFFGRLIATPSMPNRFKRFFTHCQQGDGDAEVYIQREFSESYELNVAKALFTVVQFRKSLPHYFARRAHEAMASVGTKDDDLIRIITTRSEIDMVQIRDAFHEMYQTSLANAINDDCSGDYKRLLIACID